MNLAYQPELFLANEFLRSCLIYIHIDGFSDPMLYDDKITIINIPLTEDDGEIVYNDVMNVEEFLEEHNIR